MTKKINKIFAINSHTCRTFCLFATLALSSIEGNQYEQLNCTVYISSQKYQICSKLPNVVILHR